MAEVAGHDCIELAIDQFTRDDSAELWAEANLVLLRFGRRAGLQTADAEDLAQEVLATAALRIDEFHGEHDRCTEGFRRWIFGIFRNKLRSHWRARKACVFLAELDGLGESSSFPCLANLESQTGRGISPRFSEHVARIRAEFPIKAWDAFWRVVVQEHEPAIVAAELQSSVNSVYLAKSRILRRLRDFQEPCAQKSEE